MAERWIFPSNNGGDINGIGNSGVETFRGTPIKSLAREICQNSLDANLGNGQPTRVEFSTFEIATDTIPGIEYLSDVFVRGHQFWSVQNNEKAKKFYERAQAFASQRTIHCLRISDHNTTGLTGSHGIYNTPWCNLTKSTGASDKDGTNGGSFGIGKFAPFACSAFRTVFYNTQDKAGEVAHQGVARLTSFRLPGDVDDISQGVGFFGDEKCTPVYTHYSLDPTFTRELGDSGTDVFVVAFDHEANWKQDLVASILDGFLWAIYRSQLVVVIDDITISENTLPALMEEYKECFKENAQNYYAVLTANENLAPTFEKEMSGIAAGKLILRLMIQPSMHRKCAMIRHTGMKIMDKGNISGTVPFAGVLYIEGEKLNGYLRNLENPEHTKWQAERAENKREAQAVVREIMNFVKDCLSEMYKFETRDEIDPALGEYLAFEDKGEDKQDQEKEEAVSDTIKNVTIHTITRTPNNSNIASDDEGGKTLVNDENGAVDEEGLPGEGSGGSEIHSGGGGGGGGGTEEGTGNGPNPGENEGPNPVDQHKKPMSVAPAKERTMCLNKATGEYRIVFTPSVNAENGYIKVFQSAESQAYDAVILAASCDTQPITWDGNCITGLSFSANKTVHIDVRIDYTDYTALEVKAYGHKV